MTKRPMSDKAACMAELERNCDRCVTACRRTLRRYSMELANREPGMRESEELLAWWIIQNGRGYSPRMLRRVRRGETRIRRSA